METIITALLSKLTDPCMAEAAIMPWGAPVPAFGDVTMCRVATLGLNPSNREFVDDSGIELDGELRRFHTLTSLGIRNWSEARSQHIEMIIESCKAYFNRNPYDAWFRQLDFIISGTHASYYGRDSKACHLDLIPFATVCKWTMLTSTQKKTLLRVAADDLFKILHDSEIKVLVLNGRSVVNQFQELAAVELECQHMPEWTLRRGGTNTVLGYSYMGRLRQLGGLNLQRDLFVLGFNHNIQSSFGVTNEVRKAIRDWVTNATAAAGL